MIEPIVQSLVGRDASRGISVSGSGFMVTFT